MSRRLAIARLCTCVFAFHCVAQADAGEFFARIDAGRLSASLKDLERQAGIELLYDGNAVREFSAPAINGRITTESALE